MPAKDANGVDTYDSTNYSAPVQAIIGMAGFTLDNFTTDVSSSLSVSLSVNYIYIYTHTHAYSIIYLYVDI
jgi:hypothetical protein